MSSDKIDPGDEIRYINEMLARTRKRTGAFADYFIFWGIIILLAVGSMVILMRLELHRYIWFSWFAYTILGMGLMIFKGRQRAHGTTVRTYAISALEALWSGLGIAFMFIMFLGPVMGLYSYEPLFFLSAILAGTGTFVTGRLLGAKILVWAGLGWWMGAVAMAIISGPGAIMGIYGLIVILCYLVPGFYLKRTWS